MNQAIAMSESRNTSNGKGRFAKKVVPDRIDDLLERITEVRVSAKHKKKWNYINNNRLILSLVYLSI